MIQIPFFIGQDDKGSTLIVVGELRSRSLLVNISLIRADQVFGVPPFAHEDDAFRAVKVL